MVSSSCRRQTQPKEPGGLGTRAPYLFWGLWGPRAQPSRWWSVVPCSPGAVGQALAEGCSGTHPSIGRSSPALEAGIFPSSFRKVRCGKVGLLVQGPEHSARLWAAGPLPHAGRAAMPPTGS